MLVVLHFKLTDGPSKAAGTVASLQRIGPTRSMVEADESSCESAVSTHRCLFTYAGALERAGQATIDRSGRGGRRAIARVDVF